MASMFSTEKAFSPQRLALYIVLAVSIQSMWKLLGTIQLLVHLPISNIGIPGNLSLSLQLVADLANLKLFPTDKILYILFKIKNNAA